MHIRSREPVMDPDKEEILRQREMTFIGKALTCFPHDMRKPLASIRESSALMSDLLGQAGQWNEEERKQFTGILSTIENQVHILTLKSQYLDRFAQRMDKGFSTLDPGEIVEEAVSFSSRFAHLRQASLILDAAETLPCLYGDPLLMYFLVTIVIHDMLEQIERGGKVIVQVGQKDDGVLVEVQGHGVMDTPVLSTEGTRRYWPAGQKVVDDLGGRLETSIIEHEGRRTSLFLPIKKER